MSSKEELMSLNRKNYKIHSLIRDFQECLWDVIFEIPCLNDWIAQDFYHFKGHPYGKFGRFASFGEWLEYGNFPYEVRLFKRKLRKFIGKFTSKKARNILNHFDSMAGKLLTDNNNEIVMQSWDKTKCYKMTTWLGYFILTKMNWSEDKWIDGDLLFSGFMNSKEQYRRMIKAYKNA